MKREPQNDLRYIKTEKLIQETFRNMFKEMDYAQITIKELTDRAMINRKTFYLHYNSLDELLGKVQVRIYTPVLELISDLKLPKDLEKLIQELFQFWAQADHIDEKILSSQGTFPVGESPRDYFIKSMFHYAPPDDNPAYCNALQNNIIDAYLSGSIMFIYSQWVADGRKIPLEDLIQSATWLISQGIGTLRLSQQKSKNHLHSHS